MIKAVHENDLENFLSSIEVLKDVIDGKYCCATCGQQINIENLGAIFPRDNKINFVCNLPSCLSKIEFDAG